MAEMSAMGKAYEGRGKATAGTLILQFLITGDASGMTSIAQEL